MSVAMCCIDKKLKTAFSLLKLVSTFYYFFTFLQNYDGLLLIPEQPVIVDDNLHNLQSS